MSEAALAAAQQRFDGECRRLYYLARWDLLEVVDESDPESDPERISIPGDWAKAYIALHKAKRECLKRS